LCHPDIQNLNLTAVGTLGLGGVVFRSPMPAFLHAEVRSYTYTTHTLVFPFMFKGVLLI